MTGSLRIRRVSDDPKVNESLADVMLVCVEGVQYQGVLSNTLLPTRTESPKCADFENATYLAARPRRCTSGRANDELW